MSTLSSLNVFSKRASRRKTGFDLRAFVREVLDAFKRQAEIQAMMESSPSYVLIRERVKTGRSGR